jgi:YVTN family beta-propeller protein
MLAIELFMKTSPGAHALAVLLGVAGAARAQVPLASPVSVTWHEPTRGWYVSNSGQPGSSEPGGWIARLDARDKEAEPYWFKGLGSPRGLATIGGQLYVVDGNSVVVIDIGTRAVTARLKVPGARLLHGVAGDALGNVYVSDILADAIYRLSSDRRSTVFLKSARLRGPTGLAVQEGDLIVATWGVITDSSRLATRTSGGLLRISLASKRIAEIGNRTLGNLDGLVVDGTAYLVTDPIAGTLLRVSPEGRTAIIRSGLRGPASIGLDPRHRVLAVPERDANNVLFVSLR